MTYDQAQSPRLGQRVPVESTYVRMFSGAEIPEAAWPGQIIFRTDTKILQVFDGDAWEDVAGGVAGQLTFIGTDQPVAQSVGDTWYDTDDGYKLYVWDGTTWSVAVAGAVAGTVTEYSVSSSETVPPTTGWSTSTPTRTPGTFIWVRTTSTRIDGATSTTSPALMTGNTGATGPQGDAGPQGVAGPTGPNGQQLYTWIKYADTPTTGISDSPTGKAYMGISYNHTNPTESTVYADYEWNLTTGPQGSQGVPGVPGTDGAPTYTWIKYGTSSAGAGLTDDPTGMTYMGIAYNKSTPTESTNPALYEWSLIQGPPGANAATVTLTSTSQALVSPAGGGATTPTTAVVTGSAVNTTISVYEYSVDGAAFSTSVPTGASRTGNVVTITGSTMVASTIAVRMGNGTISDTLTVAKVSNGATGSTGGTGSTGAPGADAYTVLLTNEAQVFPGSTTAALAGSTVSGVLAYKGPTQIAATIGTITGQVTGLTTSIQNNSSTTAQFTVTVTTSLTTLAGTLTVPLTVDGQSFTKLFTWSLSLAGATGATGSTGNTGPQGVSITAIDTYFALVNTGAAAPANPTGTTPSAPWVTPEPAFVAGKDLYTSNRVTYSSGSPTWTVVAKSSTYTAANAKTTTFYQSGVPTSLTINDLWYDTGHGNKLYRANAVGVSTIVTTGNGWYIITPDASALSDGVAPATSPTPVVTGGIGALYARWTAVSNHDPVTYQVHISSASATFTPDSTTLVSTGPTTSITIRQLPTAVGTPPVVDLLYSAVYYIRVIAQDVDGAAAVGTAGSAMLMQVSGPDIAAQSVNAEKIVTGSITGDLFSGRLVMGSTISTGALSDDGTTVVGARVDLGPGGLNVYDSTGTAITSFPNDPNEDAFVKQAHFEMLSADVVDNFTMHGSNNLIAATSKLVLGKGVDAPTTQPTLAWTYDNVQLDITTVVSTTSTIGGGTLGAFRFDPSQAKSLAWVPDTGSGAFWIVIQEKASGFRLWRFNPDGSVKVNPFNTAVKWVDDFIGFFHASASRNMILFQGTDLNWFLWGPSQSGLMPAAWIINTGQDPLVAYDTSVSQHMLVQNVSGTMPKGMQVRRFTQSVSDGGGVSQSVVSLPSGMGRNNRPNGMVFSAADFGGNRYVTTSETYGTVFVSTTTTQDSTNGAYRQWPTPTLPMGFDYDGTNFWSLDSAGMLTKYGSWTSLSEPTTTYVGMSGFDNRTAGDLANPWAGQTAGQHETPVGALASTTTRRRAKLLITVPATHDTGGNDDVNVWKVYWARTTGAVPTAATMKLQASIGAASTTTSTTMIADATGAVPPGGIAGQAGASNNFPGANPASYESAALDGLGVPIIQLKGDGSGRVGPFKWNSAGVDLVKNGTYMSFTSTAATNLTTGTFVTVAGWAADAVGGTTGSFISGVPSGVFTFSVAGVYQIIASGTIVTGGGANPQRRIIGLFKAGVEFQRHDTAASASGANPVTLQVMYVMRFAAGESFTVQLWQNSGATITMGAAPGHECQIIKLSD